MRLIRMKIKCDNFFFPLFAPMLFMERTVCGCHLVMEDGRVVGVMGYPENFSYGMTKYLANNKA